VDADDGVSYASGQAIVAVVTGGTAEFRLRADVAAAAARTPDAAPSPRGPEWVAFSPTVFDRFARDRIEAWFEFAVRQERRRRETQARQDRRAGSMHPLPGRIPEPRTGRR
jgi:hypothetical protein